MARHAWSLAAQRTGGIYDREVLFGVVPGYVFARIGQTILIDEGWWQAASEAERAAALGTLQQAERAEAERLAALLRF